MSTLPVTGPDAPRRSFLQLTMSGLALAGLPALAGATGLRPDVRFGASPLPQGADMSWIQRLTGTHKAVYDSPDIDGGLGVFRSAIVAAQYRQVFGLPASAISNVIVLRHDGIVLAMNQAFWDAYRIGERHTVKHPWTGAALTKNPALLTPADGLPPLLANADLPSQIAAGTIVLACSLAFADVVDTIRTGDNITEAAALTKAQSMLMRGIIMQPSGVFATTVAQEHGCIYVRAT